MKQMETMSVERAERQPETDDPGVLVQDRKNGR